MSAFSKLAFRRLGRIGGSARLPSTSADFSCRTQGCPRIYFAPAIAPSRYFGFLLSSLQRRSFNSLLSGRSSGKESSSPTMACFMTFLSLEQKGGTPTMTQKRKAPRQQQSAVKLWPTFSSIYGGMYSIEPQKVCVSWLRSMSGLLSPKSPILRWPSASRKMFSGLRSRYTTFISCMCCSPSRIYRKQMRASDSLSRFTSLRLQNSYPPGQNSVTNAMKRLVQKAQCSFSTKGWSSIPMTTRSFSTITSFPLFKNSCFYISFIAWKQPLLRFRTRYTLEKPPDPMQCRTQKSESETLPRCSLQKTGQMSTDQPINNQWVALICKQMSIATFLPTVLQFQTVSVSSPFRHQRSNRLSTSVRKTLSDGGSWWRGTAMRLDLQWILKRQQGAIQAVSRATSFSVAMRVAESLLSCFIIMELLQPYQRSKDQVKELLLEYKGITDLRPLFPALSGFVALESLSLRGNRVRQLPAQFRSLPIKSLNLQNNLIGARDALAVLEKMPRLQNLQITLSNGKADIALLSDRLPHLKRINDVLLQPKESFPVDKCYFPTEFLDSAESMFQEVCRLFEEYESQSSPEEVSQALVSKLEQAKKLLYESNRKEHDRALAEANLVKCKYLLVEESFNLALRHMDVAGDKYFPVLCKVHNQYAALLRDSLGLSRPGKKLDSGPKLDSLDPEEPSNRLRQELSRLREEYDLQQTHIAEIEAENRKYLDLIVKHGVGGQRGKSPARRSVPQKENVGLKELPTAGKMLSKKVLKDLIEEVVQARAKSERVESLESFLYTFLEKKYGLRRLVLEWATALAQGVRFYSPEDMDVALFGAMLRNEVEEDFILVQAELKNTLRELHQLTLKRRKASPDSRRPEFTAKEAHSIVEYMYNEYDARLLAKDLEQSLKAGSISFPDFQHKLLDFQLRSHRKYLSHFNELFRNYDRDEDGLLRQNEVRGLLLAIDEGLKEERLGELAGGRPLHSYSQLVSLLSREKNGEGLCLIAALNEQHQQG